MTNPAGYYSMSHEARTAIDRAERSRQDAEYEAQAAKDAAESGERKRKQAEREHKEYVADLKHQLESRNVEEESYRDRIGELQDEVVELETDRSLLIDWICLGGHRDAFLDWFKQTMTNADGTLPNPGRFADMLTD